MRLRAELCLEVGRGDYLFFAYCDLFCWNVTCGRGPWFYNVGFGPFAVGWKHYENAGRR